MARPSWKIDPENERAIVPEEGPDDSELPLPTTNSMANPGMWVHAVPNILNNCRTEHIAVEEAPADYEGEDFDAEAYMKKVEEGDPYE